MSLLDILSKALVHKNRSTFEVTLKIDLSWKLGVCGHNSIMWLTFSTRAFYRRLFDDDLGVPSRSILIVDIYETWVTHDKNNHIVLVSISILQWSNLWNFDVNFGLSLSHRSCMSWKQIQGAPRCLVFLWKKHTFQLVTHH